MDQFEKYIEQRERALDKYNAAVRSLQNELRRQKRYEGTKDKAIIRHIQSRVDACKTRVKDMSLVLEAFR